MEVFYWNLQSSYLQITPRPLNKLIWCIRSSNYRSKLFYFQLNILSHIPSYFWGLQRWFLIKDSAKGGKNHRPVRIKRHFFSLHSRKNSVSFPPFRYINRRQVQDYLKTVKFVTGIRIWYLLGFQRRSLWFRGRFVAERGKNYEG